MFMWVDLVKLYTRQLFTTGKQVYFIIALLYNNNNNNVITNKLSGKLF